MSNAKRRDNKGRVLQMGENQLDDGRYAYRYTTPFGQRKTVYSWRLTASDPMPARKRKDKSLREKIKDIEILEDYSTLKITFENPVEKAFVSLTVKNAFGDMNGVEFNGKYYENFICDDNKIPYVRDFSIQFTVEDTEDGELLSAPNLSVSVNDKLGVICFGERKSRGDIDIQKGDLITVVCEPNGLAKLYVNGELSSSAYNETLCSELNGSEIQLTDKATDLTVISKALSFKEI